MASFFVFLASHSFTLVASFSYIAYIFHFVLLFEVNVPYNMPEPYFLQLPSRLIENTYALLLGEIGSDTLSYRFFAIRLSLFSENKRGNLLFSIYLYIFFITQKS